MRSEVIKRYSHAWLWRYVGNLCLSCWEKHWSKVEGLTWGISWSDLTWRQPSLSYYFCNNLDKIWLNRDLVVEVVKLSSFCMDFEVGTDICWWKGCRICHNEESQIRKAVCVWSLGKATLAWTMTGFWLDNSTPYWDCPMGNPGSESWDENWPCLQTDALYLHRVWGSLLCDRDDKSPRKVVETGKWPLSLWLRVGILHLCQAVVQAEATGKGSQQEQGDERSPIWETGQVGPCPVLRKFLNNHLFCSNQVLVSFVSKRQTTYSVKCRILLGHRSIQTGIQMYEHVFFSTPRNHVEQVGTSSSEGNLIFCDRGHG